MKKAIWRQTKDKDKPYHDHCDINWCRYLQEIDNQTAIYVPGPGLTPECITHVKEILVDLTSDTEEISSREDPKSEWKLECNDMEQSTKRNIH